MKTRIFSLIIMITLLSLGLIGCERPASTAPIAAATLTPEFPFPFATMPVSSIITSGTAQTAKDVLGASATQTAQAQVGGGGPVGTSKPATGTAQIAPATPVPPTATPVVLPTLDKPATYALKNGEWPICIARRYNLDMNALFSLNGLNMNSRPAAGTVLRLPADTTWNNAHGTRMMPGKTTPASHVVQAGETIYTIACAFGSVNPDAIAVKNNLTAPFTLTAGQTLNIP